MNIPTPSVQVFEEFQGTPSAITNPLAACVIGPNAQLHRYAIPDEKALISLGPYDPSQETCYPWPDRSPGGIVDDSYVGVYFDDALLQYFVDAIGDNSGGRGTETAVAGFTNRVRSSALAFVGNTDFPRSALFYDRDVKIGDTVHVSGVVVEDECTAVDLWTYVTGFASEAVAAIVGAAFADASNQPSVYSAHATIEQTGGPVNCVEAIANGTGYDGLGDGAVNEVYTLTVIQSSIAGCASAALQVISASGRDNVAEVQVPTFGTPMAIGARGLTVTFSINDTTSCSSAAVLDGASVNELVAGQVFTVTVSQVYDAIAAVAGGTYAGAQDDTYVLTVTKGGVWADGPQVSVSTAKGLDFAGPTTVTAAGQQIPIGSKGVTAFFEDYQAPASSEASRAFVDTQGLCLGDKFYIPVTSSADGRISTLILQNSLPAGLRTADDLNVTLYIKDNVQISANRLSDPPNTNWVAELTEICLQGGITAYDPSWTDNGVELALPVVGGTIFVQYREWLSTLVGQLGSLTVPAGISAAIPGPLDPDNLLAKGVEAALAGSSGVPVYYTAVSDPTSPAAWEQAIAVVDGQDAFYNLVPLTFDVPTLELFHTEVDDESGPTVGHESAMFATVVAKTQKMVVGQSTTAAQLLHPTSADGQLVLATVAANPQVLGTQYTQLEVPANNSEFITYGVKPGDIVRFLFVTDAFSDATYQEFVVDTVLSENALLLFEGTTTPVSVPQKIEIWHTLTKSEVAADLVAQAQAFSDRRVCAVWPDYVGQGGVTMPGYFLGCVLAGLRSASVPQQPLTNVSVPFFDDYGRSLPFFSMSQLQTLESGGVWVVLTNSKGTPYTLHALTTDITDVNHWEESIRTNVDSIAKYYRGQLSPFIGRANVTPSMIAKLAYVINSATSFLQANSYVDTLGPQVIAATIVSIGVDPILQDTVNVVLDVTVPSPLNVCRLYLVI